VSGAGSTGVWGTIDLSRGHAGLVHGQAECGWHLIGADVHKFCLNKVCVFGGGLLAVRAQLLRC
jgi:hypothetical protein